MNTSRHSSIHRYFTQTLAAAVVAWGALSAVAAEQEDASHNKEASFIKAALQGSKMEVQMGQLAAQKAENQQVKQLGQRLQRDHTQANQMLMKVAQKHNVTASDQHDTKHQEMTQELQQKTGAEFDKAFVEHALKGHQKSITKYQETLQQTQDPALKTYIQQTLPLLREHLQMARSTGSAVGVDADTLAATEQFLKEQREGIGAAPGTEAGHGGEQRSEPQDQQQQQQPQQQVNPQPQPEGQQNPQPNR